MKKHEFVDSFLEGVNLGIDNTEKKLTLQERESLKKFKVLVGMVFDERAKVKQLTNRIEEIDSEFACANIEVKCRSCGNYYRMDYEVSQFTQEMSYCGGSDKCLP